MPEHGGRRAVKPGRHREASSTTRSPAPARATGARSAQLREAALQAYRDLELPVWRRSGFWTTSLQSLDLDALGRAPRASADASASVPEVVTRTLPERPRAGRIVQSDGSVVHVELDPALAERGVILCSLEEAFAASTASWSSAGTPSA